MNTKPCNKCGVSKNVNTGFHRNPRSRDGRKSECKECANKYSREWYEVRENRDAMKARRLAAQDLIRDRKSSTPCMDCGRIYHFSVMEFDHVRGQKYKNISQMFQTHSLKRIEEEIAKCDLVCANCHRCRTMSRIEYL